MTQSDQENSNTSVFQTLDFIFIQTNELFHIQNDIHRFIYQILSRIFNYLVKSTLQSYATITALFFRRNHWLIICFIVVP